MKLFRRIKYGIYLFDHALLEWHFEFQSFFWIYYTRIYYSCQVEYMHNDQISVLLNWKLHNLPLYSFLNIN